MLDQLTKSLEPLLMTYGIWVALFLAVMVLVPVGIVVWMQRRHQQQEHELLGEHYQSVAAFQQQLTGLETVLNQYQQQASRFSDATRAQADELIKQQEDCLARVLRLKSELRDTEVRLPQLGDQLLPRMEEAEAQLDGLKAYFQQIETWYKQLYQGVADSRTQLHQLQADLQAQPAETPAANEHLQQLWEQLRALQAETAPADPVQYQQAIQQLQQAIQNLSQSEEPTVVVHEVESKKSDEDSATPAPQADVQHPAVPDLVEAVPTPSADSDPFDILDDVLTEVAPASPEIESQAPAELPVSAVEAVEAVEAVVPAEEAADATEAATEAATPAAEAAGSFKLSQLSPEEVQALRQGLLVQAVTVPATEIPEPIPSPEASLKAEAVSSDIDALFDQADFDDFLAKDLVTEAFLGQRGGEATAESVVAEGSHLSKEQPLVAESVVLEAFLGQREPDSDKTAAAETTEHPAPELPDDLIPHDTDPVALPVTETPAETAQVASEVASEPDLDEASWPQSNAFLAARSRLAELDEEMLVVEQAYRELEMAFVPESWPESLTLLDRCRYLAAEAQEMLFLARRLHHLPQAPGHRVQLNLKRLQQKCQQVDNSRKQLQQTLLQLEEEAESLKSRLISATEQLQELREQVDPNWLQQQAGRLKDVRQALERRPFHLPVCRQQVRQVEIEIELQAQS